MNLFTFLYGSYASTSFQNASESNRIGGYAIGSNLFKLIKHSLTFSIHSEPIYHGILHGYILNKRAFKDLCCYRKHAMFGIHADQVAIRHTSFEDVRM